MTLPAAGDHLPGFTWRINPGEPSTPITLGNAATIFGAGTYTVTAGQQTLTCTVNGDDVTLGAWTGQQTTKVINQVWELRRNGVVKMSGGFVRAKPSATVDAQVVEVVVSEGDTITIDAIGGGGGVALPIGIDDVTSLQAELDAKATTTALTTHTGNTSNPHSVTKTQVGLGNVDNTSDANKPLSTAAVTALAGKASTDDLEDVSADLTGLLTDGLGALASSLGTAAGADTTDFATAAQGALAGTAVQPGDLEPGAWVAIVDPPGVGNVPGWVDATGFDAVYSPALRMRLVNGEVQVEGCAVYVDGDTTPVVPTIPTTVATLTVGDRPADPVQVGCVWVDIYDGTTAAAQVGGTIVAPDGDVAPFTEPTGQALYLARATWDAPSP